MFYHFQRCHALLNGLALLVMAAGLIAGSVLENNIVVACLAAVGTVVKGWKDFKKFSPHGGHVPVCLHHLCQDVDRTENLRARSPF